MHLSFIAPHPGPAGGGSSFNAGLTAALETAGHTIDRATTLDHLPDGAIPVVDGILLPGLEPQLDRLLERDAIAVIHHVFAAAGRDEGARAAVRAAEARMLPRLRRVVATSEPIADRLRTEFGVEATVLQPGLPVLPRSEGSGGPGCHILSVGVLTPRKGHDRLLRALRRLIDLDWTLTIAGDAERDPVHAATVAAVVEDEGLSNRVTLVVDPDLAALEPLWGAADLFALHTSWEGFPAGIAEALRRGIPVVAPAVGGIPAVLPAAAGVVAGLDDPATFGKCLRRAIFDERLRAALADAAWQAGQALPGWPQQAAAFATILRS